MRFAFISFFITVFAAVAMAVAPLHSVIISFPNETPDVDNLLAKAKDAVRAAKGEITHEYSKS
jgi:hypothetical protein